MEMKGFFGRGGGGGSMLAKYNTERQNSNYKTICLIKLFILTLLNC